MQVFSIFYNQHIKKKVTPFPMQPFYPTFYDSIILYVRNAFRP